MSPASRKRGHKLPKARRTKRQCRDGPFGSHIDDRPSHLRPPTEDEWERMLRGKAFVVGDTHFRKGDDAILHDPENDEDNCWLCKIKSICMRHTARDDEVWVLVQWYYSAKDLEDIPVKDLNLTGMSPYERMMSERLEILNAECFKDVTMVYEYREEDPDDLHIPEGVFFQRFQVDTMSGAVSPAYRPWMCCCGLPYHLYVPDWQMQASRHALAQFYHENAFHSRMPSQLEVLADVSHFCPRPECRAWYHQSCLARKHVEDGTDEPSGSRALRLLAVDPDLQEPHMTFIGALTEAPVRGKTFTSGRPLVDSVRAALEPKHLDLPDSIIEVAARPIVRRANLDQLSSHGNARDVVLARRLLYQELEELDEEHKYVDQLLSKLATREAWQDNPADYTHVWQALCVHRILASPYVPYWDKLVFRREMKVRAMMCPKCGGAI